MPKFSIVIPVFNSFKFMNKCLENFENQTFNDFELIIIDDGSTDESYENLKKYKENSKLNITLLKNEKNLGQGETRNLGIEKAVGEYITFVDSDDYIENNTLEVLNAIILKEKVNCIIYNYNLITKNNCIKQKTLLKGVEGKVSKSDALIYSTGTTLGKVYLLENIKNNKIKFPNLKRNEDMPFNKLAIAMCDSIYYCSQNLYNYVDNQESLVHNMELVDIQNNIKGFQIIESQLKNTYSKEVEAIFLREYLYAITMNLLRKNANSETIKKHITDCLKKYPNIYKNETIKYMTHFQKLCVIAIKMKSLTLLKLLLICKDIAKKIR